MDKIVVRGARTHNLKNITVTLPRDKLVVITGVSGSGKSSLAFDTIYAEGQRRYVESLSAYARQFLQLMEKPDVDSIEGLSPAISIEQKTTSKNPRSTVGTITEIYDYLRVLYARVGIPYSPATGLPIQSQTVSEIVDRILAFPEGSKFYLLAPIARGRKGEYKKEIQDFMQKGYQRMKVDGVFYEIEEIPALEKNIKHDISIVVDRLVIKQDIKRRLTETVETALKLSDGLLVTEEAETGKETLFSEKFACPISGFTLSEIEPRLFSFNSPQGACPTCDGLGVQLVFDESLVVPDPTKSVLEGAIEPWSHSFGEFYIHALRTVIKHYGENPSLPFKKLSPRIQKIILYGSGSDLIPINYFEVGLSHSKHRPFEGVIPNLERRWRETESEKIRDDLSAYQNKQICPTCDGFRLKKEALTVKVGDKNISELTAIPIESLLDWFHVLPKTLTDQQKQIAEKLLKEIEERLFFLKSVGLGYLTLARNAGTLSGGESQRIRLASQIGSGLTGVLYVLDEPSIGLHQRDNDRLLETLKRLRDLGNTVLVVEHDEDAIKAADYVIDMGPFAGSLGGEIIAAGTPDEIINTEKSLTGQYLSGHRKIETPQKTRPFSQKKTITIEGATLNNLKNVSACFPLGIFTCITGVSGGGKSSLVIETFYKALAKQLHQEKTTPGPYKSLSGLDLVDKVIDIDQSPIGRTPRSNPATYTGVFSPIRDWFAALPDAKARGYKAGRFSFNVKGGRCEACQGDGVVKIEMHFLPDVYVTCETCKGKRYNRETLEITYKTKNIADVLDMTVDDAALFFENVPLIRDKLKVLQRVGLGYIHVGQSATTLSGGEAQRVKLSKELSKRATGRTVYILDEPTTGLHFEDIRKLLEVLHALVDQGNTVIVIEHNLEVIKTADYIIDIGPEGGDAGGRILGMGTPHDITKIKESHTGKYLKAHL